MGTRGAAKALLMAAEAASAPKPSRDTAPQPVPLASASPRAATQAGQKLKQAQTGFVKGSKLFGQAAGGSVVRLAGVLWLELTGVFFGIFVLFAGSNAWKLRGNLHDSGANHAAHQHLLWSLSMTALFSYFCVTSFVRAHRREQAGRTRATGRR